MIDRLIRRMALVLAIAGGVVLVMLVVLTAVSITGRALIGIGLSPVPGIYELVELGTAFAVFSFLPWCQLNRGHVAVDMVLKPFGARVNGVAVLAGDVLMTGAAAIIAWRLWAGMLDKLSYGETTYILGLPLWIGYAAALVGAAMFFVSGGYMAWRGAAQAFRREADRG